MSDFVRLAKTPAPSGFEARPASHRSCRKPLEPDMEVTTCTGNGWAQVSRQNTDPYCDM